MRSAVFFFLLSATCALVTARRKPKSAMKLADSAPSKSDGEGCPNFEDVPVTNKEGDKFMGARVYSYPGDDLATLACNGPFEDILAGTRRRSYNCTNPDDFYCMTHPYVGGLGSLYVHPGCELQRFYGLNFKGDRKVYSGPLFEPHATEPDGGIGRDFYMSLIVKCNHKMPSCTPEDEWVTVGSLDNRPGPLDSAYKYTYTIGTSWSQEITNLFSVSSAVEAAVTTSYFKLFEATLSVSVTTGYDWSQTDSQIREEIKTHEVSTEVPAGYMVEYQQAKGYCGGSKVETNMFRTLTTTKHGKKSIKIFNQ